MVGKDMTCKPCNNYIKEKKEYSFMKCKKCNNEQFFTRREKHVAIAYVCSKCGDLVPIKEKKESANCTIEKI
jgi:predicted RNA-binding Zn-ribbon protein involved in translation (DUF1610 family)